MGKKIELVIGWFEKCLRNRIQIDGGHKGD